MNFILILGLWFDADEIKDLSEKDPVTGKMKNRLDVVRERLQLKNNVSLKIDPNGLNYNELRAMLKLRSCRFSDLTTDQLLVLRNKVLFRLEDSCAANAEIWIEKIKEILKTAEARNLDLISSLPDNIKGLFE